MYFGDGFSMFINSSGFAFTGWCLFSEIISSNICKSVRNDWGSLLFRHSIVISFVAGDGNGRSFS